MSAYETSEDGRSNTVKFIVRRGFKCVRMKKLMHIMGEISSLL